MDSAAKKEAVAVKSSQGTYEMLWEEAEKDFKRNHGTVAKQYYALEKEINRRRRKGQKRKDSDEKDGFHSTLIQTKVFLNRSRKGRTQDVREKLSKFLMIFTTVATSLSSLTSLDPVIAQPAWRGACIILQLCLNLTQKREELLSAVEKVVDIIDLYSALKVRYAEAVNFSIQSSLFKRTKRLFSNILYFQASAANRLNEHILTLGLKEAFAVDEWASMIQQIQSDDRDCQAALQNESHEKLSDMVKVLQSSLESRISLLSQRKEKIATWLSDIPIENYHTEVFDKSDNYRDRGSWFVEKVNQWIESRPKRSVYWLHDGMGKTFLTSRVIEMVEEMGPGESNRQLAYFYFSGERGKNNPEDAFRSLLSQLAITPDGSIAPSIDSLYDFKPRPKLTLKQCQKELSTLIEAQAQTIIIIDAVDECNDYGRFLRALKDMVPKDKSSVKIFLSSKEGIRSEVTTIFQKHTATRLDAATNEEDIKHYINIQVKERDKEPHRIGARLLQEYCRICSSINTLGSCKECKGRAALEDRLVKLLAEKNHGMFKWVELQISLFFQPNSPFKTTKDVEDQLEKLRQMTGEPRLDKVYAQIMERNATGSEARKIADRVYKWLLYSLMPLSMKQLAEAVSINSDGSKTQAVDISNLCSNLIDVSDNKVLFAHPSIRKYLEGVKDRKGTYLYSATESHTQIATTCLAYLKGSPMPKVSSHSFEGTKWDFKHYAATFWPTHLKEVSEIHKSVTLRDLTNEFFFRKGAGTRFKPWAEAWKKIYYDDESKKRITSKGTTDVAIGFGAQFPDTYSLIVSMLSSLSDPFFAACMFGLPDVCGKSNFSTSQKSQMRNVQDELGVFLAIKSNRLDALEMLISNSVDITNVWQKGNNTIHWAATYGSVQMLKTLLEQGVDVSSTNDDGATALHLAAASREDTLKKITLLSKAGLDPNRPDAGNATVLHYAVQGPVVSAKILEALKNLGADFKMTDSKGKTALHYAAENPNLYTRGATKLLDETASEIDKLDESGKPALTYLVTSRSVPPTKLIELFIRWDADLTAADDEGTVLHHAVKNSKFSTSLVEKLIRKDAINKPDKLGRTPLHCAIMTCQESSTTASVRMRAKTIALMLLGSGADCTIPDNVKSTALHYLARAPTQPSDLLDVLLKKKIDIKAANNLGETALHIALKYNKLSTQSNRAAIKKLIKAKGDLKIADRAGETVLHRAVRNADITVEILSLLVDEGIDINAADKKGSTALHYAVELRSTAIVQFLLNQGADVKAVDLQQASMLHHAAACVKLSVSKVIPLLVKEGLDVNALDKQGRTPLHIAAQSGSKNGVSVLVKRCSADIHATDENGDTALHFATLNTRRSVEIVTCLLDNGIAVSARNKNKEIALHKAAKKDSVEAIRILLDKKASCIAKGRNGDTPLHYAAQRPKPSAAIIEILIDANADVLEATNNSGDTALHCAIRSRTSSEGYCTLLRKGASTEAKNSEQVRAIDVVTNDGRTALHHAAKEGWLDAVETLLKHKAVIDARDKNLWAPISLAASSGHDAVLKRLLQAKASVNLGTKDGTTPLHLAAANGHHVCTQLLVEKHSNLEERDQKGRTPLWRAVVGNHESVARLLLQNKANCKVKTPDKRTILHRAGTFGFTSIARLLLENGASLESEDKWGGTPLHQAIMQKHEVTMALFLDHGSKTAVSAQMGIETELPKEKLARRDVLISRLLSVLELEAAAAKGDRSGVEKILSNSSTADLVDVKNERGRNALLSAAFAGHHTVVSLLIDKFHADLDTRTEIGGTALHCAAEQGHTRIAKLLINRKTALNALNDRRRTPLHIAARYGQLEVVELLIGTEGVELSPLDKESETPLMLALRFGHEQVAEVLAAKDGVDVEKADAKLRTPMHWAALKKFTRVKAQLLKRGAKAESDRASEDVKDTGDGDA